MNLRYLQTFISVAEVGSIARVGTRLNVSQPAASRQILALEAELGVHLFDRIGRRLRLTAEGEDLLRLADGEVRRNLKPTLLDVDEELTPRRQRNRLRRSAPEPAFGGRLLVQVRSEDRRWPQADGMR